MLPVKHILLYLHSYYTSLTSLFILQPEDHRPMWCIHTITGEHRY